MAKGKKGIELGKKIVEKIKKRKDGKPDQRFKNNKAVSVKAAEQKARQKAVIASGAGAFGLAGLTAALLATARKNKNKSGKTFDEAFRTARNKGEGTKFTFNGKSYTAVTKDDLKKKGYSSLAEYNRAGGKKKIDVDAAAKKIAGEVEKNKKPKTMRERIRARRKKRIGFETFKERRQARRANRRAKRANDNSSGIDKMKSGGVVSARRSKPRGVGAAKRGFGRALKG